MGCCLDKIESSFLLLAGVAQLDALDLVDLLGVDDQLRVEGVQLFRLLEVFSCRVVVLQRFEGKGTPKVGVTVLGLELDHFSEVLKRFLVLISKEVALCSFVDVAGLIVSQLDSLSERW